VIEAGGAAPAGGRSARLLLLLAAAFALLRLAWLGADPGYLVADVLTDEGWYALNARNHVLFGSWVWDEHNVALVLCPLHTLALRASYALSGVSFASSRLPGALAAALTVGLVAWRLRRQPAAAALAAALVATQPVLFSLSRAALAESLQLLFVTLTWALASAERPRRLTWLLAGAAAGLALASKATALYAPALALAAPFLVAPAGQRGRAIAGAAWAAAGGLLVALPTVAFEWPHLGLLARELVQEGAAAGFSPRGSTLLFLVGLVWSEEGPAPVVAHPAFWAGLFPLLALAGAAGGRALVTRPATAAAGSGSRLALAWTALAAASLSFRATPALAERYWANLLVPLSCLAALACGPRGEREEGFRWRAWAAALLLAVGPALLLRSAVLAARGQALARLAEPLLALAALAALGAGLAALLLHASGLAQGLARARLPWRALAAAVALVGAAASAASVLPATFTIRDTARALGREPPPRVLAGDVANSYALETPFRAFVTRDLSTMGMGRGWVNGDWRALGATHWLVDRPAAEPPPAAPVPGAVLESTHLVWPDRSGAARRKLYVFALPG